MTDLSVPSRHAEFLRRLGVTIAAVILYRIGCWIPLPGIDISTLLGYGSDLGSFNTNIERLSIMALGVVPLLSALIVAEVAMMIAPSFRAGAQKADNAANLDGWIVVVALSFAAFQANGFAVALEGIDSLVPAPGLAFRAGIIVAFVAATAFLIWLAAAVSRHGLGSGFLLLLAMPLVISIPSMLATQAVAWGPASELSIPLTLALLAGTTAALVVAGTRTPSLVRNGQLLWPALLGYGLAGWLLVPLMLVLPPQGFADLVEMLKLGQPARVVVMPVLTLAFYFWRARSLEAVGEAMPAGDWITPLLLALVVGAAEFLLFMMPVPLMFDGRSVIIIVSFAISMLAAAQALLRPSLERGS
ncbi:MAG TPA: hypothetical protein VEA77_00360 [Hyphomicrobium sp.]|nr:hypothetical protein [Hyphomicrobium sp.]